MIEKKLLRFAVTTIIILQFKLLGSFVAIDCTVIWIS